MPNTMTATEFLATLAAPINTRASFEESALTKTMRDEIAAAVRVGALPAGTKVSVRKNHYHSFTVEIVEWRGAVFCDAYVASVLDPATKFDAVEARNQMHRDGLRRGDERYTTKLCAALELIEAIVDRHNYNDSRIEEDYFNVGYYLTVTARTVAANAEQGLKAESDPTYAELLRQAEIAAKAVGPKVVRSVCGRGGVQGCGQHALERLVRMAAKANGRELAYDKWRHGWVVAA